MKQSIKSRQFPISTIRIGLVYSWLWFCERFAKFLYFCFVNDLIFYLSDLQAEDHGIKPLSSNVTVVISLLDINDNTPKFDKTIYNISVDENVPGDSQVRELCLFASL